MTASVTGGWVKASADEIVRHFPQLADLRGRLDSQWIGLDEGIQNVVLILNAAHPPIETYESCQGGEGHSYSEPSVRFYGSRGEGFRALAWLQAHGLPVTSLRRIWQIIDGEATGPNWEVVFDLANSQA